MLYSYSLIHYTQIKACTKKKQANSVPKAWCRFVWYSIVHILSSLAFVMESSYHLGSGGRPSWQPGGLTGSPAWGRGSGADSCHDGNKLPCTACRKMPLNSIPHNSHSDKRNPWCDKRGGGVQWRLTLTIHDTVVLYCVVRQQKQTNI